jgi:hypothetical protein
VLHDHSGPLGATLLAAPGRTVLHTVHGPLDAEMSSLYRTILSLTRDRGADVVVSSPTERLRGHAPVGRQHPEGIDTSRFALGSNVRDDYLLVLGRMRRRRASTGRIVPIEYLRTYEKLAPNAARRRTPARALVGDVTARMSETAAGVRRRRVASSATDTA